MTKLSTVLITAVILACAAPAVAQTPPTPSSGARDRPYVPVMPGQRAEYETFLDSASGNNIASQPIERIDLANRVSVLIELGRCDEARALAREAGDRQMALRARQLCRADRNT